MYNNNMNNFGSSNFGSSSQNPNPQGSQYQGSQSQYQAQRQYQPTTYVQSYYNQQTPAQSTKSYNQNYNQGMASAESYHTANYRGNQPGNDAYLRSESATASNYQPSSSFQNAYSTYNSNRSNQNNQFASATHYQPISYTSMNQPSSTSQYGTSSTQMFNQQQPFGQSHVSSNAYHTANYRGNQPGHDAYLRSDSSTPSSQSYASQQNMQGFSYQPQQSFYQQNSQSSGTGFGSTGMGQQFGYSNH